MLLSDANRVAEAIRFKNSVAFWLGIGRTTPWPDENNPPLEDRSQTAVEELIGLKKVTTLELVYPDVGGSITYRGQEYSVSTEVDAYTNVARFVLLSAQLVLDTFPVVSFRQICVVSGCLPDQDIILPGEVTNAGVVEGIDNRKTINRAVDETETLSYIFPF